MDRAAAEDFEILVIPDGGPHVIGSASAVGPDTVCDLRDHPTPHWVAVSGTHTRIVNGPVVTALNHRDTQTVAGLRIHTALGESSGDDAAGGAAAQDDHVVIVVAVARFDGRR